MHTGYSINLSFTAGSDLANRLVVPHKIRHFKQLLLNETVRTILGTWDKKELLQNVGQNESPFQLNAARSFHSMLTFNIEKLIWLSLPLFEYWHV